MCVLLAPCLLVLSLYLPVCYCIAIDNDDIVVNWTVTPSLTIPSQQQRWQSGSLLVTLGDRIVFSCPEGSYSNVFYISSEQSFNDCDCNYNCSAVRIGECLGASNDVVPHEIRATSASLLSSIPYEIGQTFFFTSFSDGLTVADALSNRRSGGECLQGIKLKLQVVDPNVVDVVDELEPGLQPTDDEGSGIFPTTNVLGLDSGSVSSHHSQILTISVILCGAIAVLLQQ